jgi:NADH-quinone oxidoreductase subunit H
MKFGLLFLSEFSNIFVFSSIIVTLFFGGWAIPFVPVDALGGWAAVVFMLKVYLVIFVLMWIRGTLPRVRIDQLLSLGWKVLLPASLAWVMISGIAVKVWPTLFGGAR